MSRVFFTQDLEGVATFWRVHRKDGVTLGFTSHDRDLWFDGVLHRAAPGMLPSAIRRTSDLTDDSADVQGALSHDSISSADLAAGNYDSAAIESGAVDWENLDRTVLYTGTLGSVSEDAEGFTAELRSAKAALEIDPIPRTSPTCRAQFCGPGCTLSAAKFTHESAVTALNLADNRVQFAAPDWSLMESGEVRWIDGPHVGVRMQVVAADAAGLVVDTPLDQALTIGARALLREGCDHTLATCRTRFANTVNFRGEPFLPGNDLLARYPSPQ